MADRGNQQAQDASKSANAFSSGLQGQAGALYSSAAPQLAGMATHPQGMSPEDLAASRTAAAQSAGGSRGAAVGQGSLLSARTNNAGGADAAIADAARSAGQEQGDAALKTQLENTSLKQHQQDEGLKGE